tara:strand:+ start:297 stop:851 length:555 start_codon:yes stop_codon:yes gene_type:complete
MSKNKFKKQIQEKYKGRGNTWVKIPKDSQAFQSFLNLIPDCSEGSTFLNHVNREGFGWARFSKVEGTELNPIELFEVRYKGSKLDHANNLLIVSHSISKDFPLLGNTPVKLDIEVLPENRKAKKSTATFKRKVTKSSEEVIEDFQDVEQEIRMIKEAALTKPSNRELENWYEFLKLNGLYEENV